ncbi:MAG: hypothetical protein Q6373_007875 [Candidatus Sigynarchaeota archaeon]
MEIAVIQNNSFQEMVRADHDLARFKDLLSRFLLDAFFSHIGVAPTRVEFTLFSDPETSIERPMVEIVLPQGGSIDRATMQHEFVSLFKAFLVQHARDPEDFVSLRRAQRHFMVIFTFE